MEIIILCNQASEGTLCHFYHILWIISKSLGPGHAHVEGIIQGDERTGGGDYGRPFEAAHPIDFPMESWLAVLYTGHAGSIDNIVIK